MIHDNLDMCYTIEKTDIIRKFDCCVLSIDFQNGGGFSTAFPISDKTWRQSRKYLPDKVVVNEDAEYTTFLITDDWGNEYEIAIDNIHHQDIQHAKEKATEYGLI